MVWGHWLVIQRPWSSVCLMDACLQMPSDNSVYESFAWLDSTWTLQPWQQTTGWKERWLVSLLPIDGGLLPCYIRRLVGHSSWVFGLAWEIKDGLCSTLSGEDSHSKIEIANFRCPYTHRHTHTHSHTLIHIWCILHIMVGHTCM